MSHDDADRGHELLVAMQHLAETEPWLLDPEQALAHDVAAARRKHEEVT